MEGPSGNRAALRALALIFLPVLVAATALLVTGLTRPHPPVLLLLAAAVVLAQVILAAALAALALVRRSWWWATGLLVAWPLVTPFELWRRSGEVEG